MLFLDLESDRQKATFRSSGRRSKAPDWPIREHFGKRGQFGGARFATVLLRARQLAVPTFERSWDCDCSFKYLTERKAST